MKDDFGSLVIPLGESESLILSNSGKIRLSKARVVLYYVLFWTSFS